MRLKGVDIYLILHWDLNPSGHVSRFHSYQAWFRDGTGAVSHMNGWLDFATNANDTGPNLVLICGINSNERPIMQVNRGDCPAGTPLIDEVWYPRAGSSGNWSIDLGMNSPSNYYAGGDPNDPATWTPLNGFASNNLRRRVEVAWYADRSNLRGDFWTTQWGDVVSGPTDALCDGLHTRTYGTKTYTVLCLKQTIQPSLTPIVFPSNSFQTTYPGGSGSSRVQLPN